MENSIMNPGVPTPKWKELMHKLTKSFGKICSAAWTYVLQQYYQNVSGVMPWHLARKPDPFL